MRVSYVAIGMSWSTSERRASTPSTLLTTFKQHTVPAKSATPPANSFKTPTIAPLSDSKSYEHVSHPYQTFYPAAAVAAHHGMSMA